MVTLNTKLNKKNYLLVVYLFIHELIHFLTASSSLSAVSNIRAGRPSPASSSSFSTQMSKCISWNSWVRSSEWRWRATRQTRFSWRTFYPSFYLLHIPFLVGLSHKPYEKQHVRSIKQTKLRTFADMTKKGKIKAKNGFKLAQSSPD